MLIDEGQDLKDAYYALLLTRLKSGEYVPPHTIAFDANQTILGGVAREFRNLDNFFDDVVSLTYNYRSTAQIAKACMSMVTALHDAYIGLDNHDETDMDLSRDPLTARCTFAMTGPTVGVHLVDECSKIYQLLPGLLRDVSGAYMEPPSMAVILVSAKGMVGAVNRMRIDEAELSAVVKAVDGRIRVLSPGEAKGSEFLAGVVVDMLTYPPTTDGLSIVSRKQYRFMCGAYVALSRFRDRAEYVCVTERAPLYRATSPTKSLSEA